MQKFSYLIDGPTPKNAQLAPLYKKSEAFYYLKDELPVIITNIIDTLAKDRDEITKTYGPDANRAVKDVIANLSRLKYAMQTDKRFLTFEENEPDMLVWNLYIEQLPERQRTFYGATWFDSEFYLYRRISSFFVAHKALEEFDCFGKKKKERTSQCEAVFPYLLAQFEKLNPSSASLQYLFQLIIWHKTVEKTFASLKDLSLSDFAEKMDTVKQTIKSLLLVNDVEAVWQCLRKNSKEKALDKQKEVHIILGECGIELFASFLLASFLIDNSLASSVVFHPKPIPFRVYEATAEDLKWLPDHLSTSSNNIVRKYGSLWKSHLKDHKFKVMDKQYYWTTPFPFYLMHARNEELFEELHKAHLLIFCGDLNYRKLLGDLNCDIEDDFLTRLRGFNPTNLVAVRAIETPIVCGLKKAEEKFPAFLKNEDWFSKQSYGVIQFSDYGQCNCHHPESLIAQDYFAVEAPSETCVDKLQKLKIQPPQPKEKKPKDTKEMPKVEKPKAPKTTSPIRKNLAQSTQK